MENILEKIMIGLFILIPVTAASIIVLNIIIPCKKYDCKYERLGDTYKTSKVLIEKCYCIER